MGAMREIEWDSCLIEPIPAPKLEQRFRRETGRPGSLMRFFEGSSWLSDAVVRLSVQLNTHVRVDAELADEAGLVVSQDNSCRFCFGAQRAFLRVLGMSEARITRLEQNLLVGDFSERERAALDFARRLSRSEPLSRRRRSMHCAAMGSMIWRSPSCPGWSACISSSTGSPPSPRFRLGQWSAFRIDGGSVQRVP